MVHSEQRNLQTGHYYEWFYEPLHRWLGACRTRVVHRIHLAVSTDSVRHCHCRVVTSL